ncbi:MAG: type II secretion system inner membrane protein GspF [Spongiibacteraceae bacterium]|nr:type II secretion system inner membrane protein GspF [Spongiibacteraceae bacterium]
MAAYSYAALDSNGIEKKGLLEADSPRQVRQLLRDKGLAPLRIESAVKTVPSDKKSVRFHRGPTMKVGDLALITRQLATLIQSGMPLEESLTAVSRQSENSKVSAIVSMVRSKVLEGYSLANSMEEFPRVFPTLYRATVSAGEHAGHLDLVLNRLADYTENAHSSRQKAMLALIYPVLLFVLALAIIAGLMAFVVPDIVEVFAGQDQQLPLLTRGLISTSDFVVDFGVVSILIGIAGVMGIRVALRNDAIQLRWHKRQLDLPLIGRFSRRSDTARYASTLSILTSSGVPLVDAMKISCKVIGNLYLQQRAQEATREVSEGGSLHQALERCGYFPPMMIHMIASGEVSGSLDSMLERVSESQQRELYDFIATLIGILEPAMILFMGVAVLIIVIAILQPIFDMNQLI